MKNNDLYRSQKIIGNADKQFNISYSLQQDILNNKDDDYLYQSIQENESNFVELK